MKKLLLILFIFVTTFSLSYAVDDLMPLQGTVYNSTGSLVSSGDVQVLIYNASTGGNLVYNSSSDFDSTISNGQYDIILGSGSVNLTLEFGAIYYLDILINGEDLDFNGNERQVFQSTYGTPTELLDGDNDTTYSNVSEFANDAGYLTTEVDGNSSNELQSLSFNDSTNILTISSGNVVNLSDLQDVSNFTDTNCVNTDSCSNITYDSETIGWDTNASDDFDGVFSSLSSIPSGLSDGDDDTIYTAGIGLVLNNSVFRLMSTGCISGYVLKFDGSEWGCGIDDGGTSYLAGLGIILSGSNFSLNTTYLDANYVGQNEYPNLDTDSTDDFDGVFSSLSSIPSGLSDGDNDTTYSNVSEFTNDAGYLTTEVDGNSSNELQSLNYNDTTNVLTISSGNAVNLSDLENVGGNFTDTNCADTGSCSNITYDSETSAWDTNASDDFDGVFSSLSSIPSGLSDGDDDTTYASSTGLILTGSNFSLNTTYLDANYVGQSEYPNLDTDSTDDFDGVFSSLSSIPGGLSDGDNDTTYTAGSGLELSGTTFSANTTYLDANYVGQSEYANLDTDSTDDFDGVFSSLSSIPSGLSDGDDDTTYTAGIGLVLNGSVFRLLSSGCISGQVLEFNGSNWACGTDDSGSTYVAGLGITLSGSNFSLNTTYLDANYVGQSEYPNLDTDSTDDFDGVFSSLSSIPSGLSDGDNDTTYSNVSEFANDVGYLTTEVDGNSSNELQSLNYNDTTNVLTISSGNTVNLSDLQDTGNLTDTNCADTGSCSNITYDSETSAWDTNVSDDFDGNWSSLSGVPVGLDDGDDDTTFWTQSGTNLTYTSGNVGVGTSNPVRNFHISDTLRIEPRASAPTSPSLGDIYVDSDSNELCFYNGGNWTGLVGNGVCS